MKTKVLLFMFVVMTNVIMTRAAIVNGTCGEGLTWMLNTKDSTLTIEGGGVITSKPWEEYNRYIATVIFPEGLTNNSVNKIFNNCANLHNIEWNAINYHNDSMYSYNAFAHAGDYYAYHPLYAIRDQITSVTFGENVLHIPSRLCYQMENIHSVTSKAVSPPETGSKVFYEVPFSSIPLYAPYESLTAYSNTLWWEEFSPIRPIGYYMVQFIDWDGTILSSNYVKEGQSATTPEIQAREGYTFIGWDKPYNGIIEDITITALYKINRYLVQFVDWDGSIIKEYSVNYGNSANAPTPIRKGYTFIGWNGDFNNVTTDLIVTAQYKINKYKVEFVDWDESILKSDSVEYNNSAIAPMDPIRNGYVFIGWDQDFSHITSDLKIIAQYKLAGYTVVFLDYNSIVLSEQFVKENESAIEPEAPYREGYNFIGWNIEYDHIIAPTFVIATYEKIETDTLLVVFKDDLNNIVSSQNIVCTIPNAPIRDNKQFIGWYIGETFLEYTLVVQAKYDEEQGIYSPKPNNNVVRKEIREGKVFVIRNNKTYTLQGQEVK